MDVLGGEAKLALAHSDHGQLPAFDKTANASGRHPQLLGEFLGRKQLRRCPRTGVRFGHGFK